MLLQWDWLWDCVTAAISQLNWRRKKMIIQYMWYAIYSIACFGVISFDRALVYFSVLPLVYSVRALYSFFSYLTRVSWFVIETDLFVSKNGIQLFFLLRMSKSRWFKFRSYPFAIIAKKKDKIAFIFSTTDAFVNNVDKNKRSWNA